MAVGAAELATFAAEVRRLRSEPEPTLYRHFQLLLEAAVPRGCKVDAARAAPGAGYPDITVSKGKLLRNWIEVKSPSVSIDPLPPTDAARFGRYLTALPHIVLTNGWHWRLFVKGRLEREVRLPQRWLTAQQSLAPSDLQDMATFLQHVASLSPADASSDEEAVQLLATAARLIAGAVRDLDPADYPADLAQARKAFSDLLRTNPADRTDIEPEEFADALAQAATFGLLLARAEAGEAVGTVDAWGFLDATEQGFLKKTLHGLMKPEPAMEAAFGGVLRTACDAINRAANRLTASDGGWRKITYVYEQFFAAYRPEDRFKFGVFYTPEEVTHFQVRQVQRTLREDFGLTGLCDDAAIFLDPACGTGTYLVALAEAVEAEATEAGLPVGAVLHDLFAKRVAAFEVSPGPACVAQARMAAWLKSRGVKLGVRVPVFTVNALTPPAAGPRNFGDSMWRQLIAEEQNAGDTYKRDKKILVVLGNPPWGSRDRTSLLIDTDTTLIDEWAQDASAAVINLYDLYVAFWMFACRLLLERPAVQQPRGIVSFITNRAWLRGRAYTGMRKWLRARDVHATIHDLGGDIRAGAKSDDEPIFEIKTGSAISTLAFGCGPASEIQFSRCRGSRGDKLGALKQDAFQACEVVPGAGGAPFAPVDWGPLADAVPLADFFAKNYPGVKTHRDDLVIDVTREALLEKLKAWNASTPASREERFHPSRDRALPPVEMTIDPELIRAHRYRPLDERWLFTDRRMIDQPGGISHFFEDNKAHECLISMDTRTGLGPVVIAASSLPGYNSFRGSYETHVYPLSGVATHGSGTLGLKSDPLTVGARAWMRTLAADELALGRYLLALGNAPSYSTAFVEALETEMVRFPVTTDPAVFGAAAELGESLMNAWCLRLPPLGRWTGGTSGADLGAASYEAEIVTLGCGATLAGVKPEVWGYSVSDYPVLQRYLEARVDQPFDVQAAKGIGRVVAALSAIVAAQAASDELLRRAIATSRGGLPARP